MLSMPCRRAWHLAVGGVTRHVRARPGAFLGAERGGRARGPADADARARDAPDTASAECVRVPRVPAAVKRPPIARSGQPRCSTSHWQAGRPLSTAVDSASRSPQPPERARAGEYGPIGYPLNSSSCIGHSRQRGRAPAARAHWCDRCRGPAVDSRRVAGQQASPARGSRSAASCSGRALLARARRGRAALHAAPPPGRRRAAADAAYAPPSRPRQGAPTQPCGAAVAAAHRRGPVRGWPARRAAARSGGPDRRAPTRRPR